METESPRFKKYIFVCENERAGEACCMPDGQKIRETIKNRVKELGLSDEIRVSRSGCQDVCSEGPNVLLMPDHVWFKHVRPGDEEKILDRAIGKIKT